MVTISRRRRHEPKRDSTPSRRWSSTRQRYTATMATSKGTIVIELDPLAAPEP